MREDFFSYNQETEQKEDLDFNQLVKCPHCKKPIPQDAISCYYCGSQVDFNKKPKWVYLVVFLVTIILLSYLIFF
ncbi:MAG: zinc ribbon domain-containing protein [Candidatus Omnitrophica bacterium]|nr:zinc ribbon domain-containing protein [Candidatus Omnitrophota bacterium]MCF7892186.1 zinc ribbon domain-containing protein [Candidatus Omnitrophota bacterium]MCF7897440.1 zinc ribbon domain-containing protein [Candidatus Omnitrophota bacterium]MCF7909382.1 zinc ribbon domain-containing protein [Candidatus Omnitrophota bacterium]